MAAWTAPLDRFFLFSPFSCFFHPFSHPALPVVNYSWLICVGRKRVIPDCQGPRLFAVIVTMINANSWSYHRFRLAMHSSRSSGPRRNKIRLRLGQKLSCSACSSTMPRRALNRGRLAFSFLRGVAAAPSHASKRNRILTRDTTTEHLKRHRIGSHFTPRLGGSSATTTPLSGRSPKSVNPFQCSAIDAQGAPR